MQSPLDGLSRRPRIVIADEDPSVVQFVIQTLRQDGNAVFHAYDAISAVQLAFSLDRCDLLVLEAPDRWASGEREALSDLLEIALPQARKTVYLQPAHALLGSQRAAGRLGPAGADTLQQICEEFAAASAEQTPAETSSPKPMAAAS